MPSPNTSIPAESGTTRLRPLIHVGDGVVELVWLDNGIARHASLAVDSSRADVIAVAVRDLLVQSIKSRPSFVLCLDDQAFDTQQLLLGSLPDREAAQVLARRAANALGVEPEEALYWAQRLCPPFVESTEDAESNWILHARRRREHTELLMQLRSRGLKVARVVALRDVLPRIALNHGKDGEVLVTYDGALVSTHLLRAGVLVQISRLRVTRESTSKEVNLAIVQEVRQVAAFWSKGSRGAPLDTVSVLGLSEEQLEEMATPLSIAGLGAPIQRVGSCAERTAESARRAFLFTVARTAGLARDLSLPLPPRRSRVVLAAALATAAAGLVALSYTLHWNTRVAERRSTIADLGTRAQGVDESRAARLDYESARHELAEACRSLAALPQRDLPFEQALQRVRSQIGGVARLNHISLAAGESGTSLLIEGAIERDLDAAATQLNRLRTSLQGQAWMKNVVVEPSSRIPDNDTAVGLSFSLLADSIDPAQ